MIEIHKRRLAQSKFSEAARTVSGPDSGRPSSKNFPELTQILPKAHLGMKQMANLKNLASLARGIDLAIYMGNTVVSEQF
jgi:hypothetical protein